jgi:hypothetical protein
VRARGAARARLPLRIDQSLSAIGNGNESWLSFAGFK